MTSLLGIYLDNFILPINELVGTLLFEEFPSTVVFSDSEGNPIIKEWVDCSDSGDIDRYFYYKTSKHLLKNFIDGHLSHQDLILQSLDGLLYFQDIKQKDPINNYIITSNLIPNEYKPSGDFFFDKKEGVDVEKVINYFELNKVEDLVKTYNNTIVKIQDIVINKKIEVFNLHLNKGEGIGFGTVNTDILGKTLIKFDKLYKDIGLDLYKGKNRGAEINYTNKERKILTPKISTEMFGNLAASFSVLLKPKFSQFDLYSGKTETEIIANKIFTLLNKSNLLEDLRTEYILHSDFTINSFKNFLKEIYEMRINLDLNWFSSNSSHVYNEELNYLSANQILSNLSLLSIDSEEKFEKIGKFRAINCDTAHYNFVSNDQDQFTGYFDKKIKEGSERINFLDIYKVVIERKTIKEPGRTEAKILDTIIAFYEETEI